MNLFKCCLLSFALFLSLNMNISGQDWLPKGLIAWYSFDYCDARDESGNGSDGILGGSLECWCGVRDDGLLFDGVNDYLEFPGPVNSAFNTTDFTISFYFRPASLTTYPQSLLSKRATCEEYQMLDIQFDGSRRLVSTEVHETPEKDYPGLSPIIDSTQWQHFVLVRQGTRAYTYINGQLRNQSRRCSGVDITNEARLSFSNSPCLGAGLRRFKGVLDELMVFERALTEAEVHRLYATNPVEQAEQDCYTLAPKKPLPGNGFPAESTYLCRR